ncbi:hypothetical protein E2562_035153 [Oryza meyeriana var. granulata]|uniref:Uncharacterized protein n=1 Tax=Oryza meyeriana var. granulata TaxID=110450 RepID=A0A6G1E705_9ORYZ|nr:hypothetical protein E2562_035153 [Oryza meyeriana var. granulata]
MPASVVVRPIPTTEDDTTAATEVSSTIFADVDEAARRSTQLTSATEDCPATEEDPATTAEWAPTSIAIATIEGDTTAVAKVSSTIVTNVDNPIATIDLAAMTIDDE